MKNIKRVIMSVAILVGVAGAVLPTATAGAINVFDPDSGAACTDDAAAKTDICKAGKTDKLQGYVKPIINIILYILAVVAVIVIIIGGFMYVVSGGDSATITKAKNTILYAVIGLVVAILAYAIVNFVVMNIK